MPGEILFIIHTSLCIALNDTPAAFPDKCNDLITFIGSRQFFFNIIQRLGSIQVLL